MPKNQSEAIDKCKRFLNRCIVNPEYRVLLFLSSNEKLQYFKEEMLPLIAEWDEDMLSVKIFSHNIELRFQNGSRFNVVVIDGSGCCGTRANVVLVDSDIREAVLKKVAQSCICVYRHDGCEMINPKPIYVKILPIGEKK